jgi:uncharacterized membrane protein YbaN (DUF454 family)
MLLKTARKVVVGVLGSTIVLLGIAGLLLPVLPGWVLIIPGLALLGTEFLWARRLLRKTKEKAQQAYNSLRGSPSRANATPPGATPPSPPAPDACPL